MSMRVDWVVVGGSKGGGEGKGIGARFTVTYNSSTWKLEPGGF